MLKELAANTGLLSDVSQKVVCAGEAFDFLCSFHDVANQRACSDLVSWVVLSALDVLNTVTAAISYCNKTLALALALNRKFLFRKLFFILVPISCTKAFGFVM